MSSTAPPATAAEAPAPLAPEWLLDALPTDIRADLDFEDSSFEDINSLIIRGDYIKAGQRSEALFHSGIYDVRVLGYYLMGVYCERGISSLPLLCRILLDFLASKSAAYGPSRKKQIQTENMLLWLFSSILKKAELHSSLKDNTWKEWMEAKHRPAIEEARKLSEQMLEALNQFAPQARALPRFRSLSNWLNGLEASEAVTNKPAAPALSKSANVAASALPLSAPEVDKEESFAEPEEEEEEEEVAEEVAAAEVEEEEDEEGEVAEAPPRPVFGRSTVSRVASAPQKPPIGEVHGSAEWQFLQERLRAFETLLQTKQFLKAAVLASDIQASIASFDPIVYFPNLFAPFLAGFAEHMRALERCMNNSAALKFKVMSQLYRADFKSFMGQGKEEVGDEEE